MNYLLCLLKMFQMTLRGLKKGLTCFNVPQAHMQTEV